MFGRDLGSFGSVPALWDMCRLLLHAIWGFARRGWIFVGGTGCAFGLCSHTVFDMYLYFDGRGQEVALIV